MRIASWLAAAVAFAALVLASQQATAGEPDLSKYSLGQLPYDSYTAGRALNGSRNPMPGEQVSRSAPVYYPQPTVRHRHGGSLAPYCSPGYPYVYSYGPYGYGPTVYQYRSGYYPVPVYYPQRSFIYYGPGGAVIIRR